MPIDSLLRGLVILVVDDNEDARIILEKLLITCGALVLTAASGIEALKILAERSPHVLLSDIAMPGMDGLTLLQKIREQERARHAVAPLPAGAVTAYTQSEDKKKCYAVGYGRHIAKPFDLVEIVNAVRYLARESHIAI